MATVQSTGAWKVKIYADDHASPHFHVQTADGESLVEIESLKEIKTGANRKALKEALVWAASNQPTLKRVWDEQNRRN